MSPRFWLYLTVLLSSAPKFMVGVAFAWAGGLNFLEMFICTSVGGMLGITVFTFFGEGIRAWWQQRQKRRKGTHDEPYVAKPPSAFAQRIWDRFGLPGVALLTPPFLSPPIGTAIALAFGTPRVLILGWMYSSMILWALVFSAFGGWIQSVLNLAN